MTFVAAGAAAARRLLADGINVNITLLFGLPRYREVAEAFIDGLEDLAGQGKPLDRIASVASFFLSRIDSVIDPIEENYAALGGEQVHFATSLKGMVAISSAKLAYVIYKDLFESEQFETLSDQGATRQRLLWASTGTKNKEYSDIKYVEDIIGKKDMNSRIHT